MTRRPDPAQLRKEAAEHRAEAAEILRRARDEADPLLFLAASKEQTADRMDGRLTLSRDDTSLRSSRMESANAGDRKRAPAREATKLQIGKKNATRSCAFGDWLDATDQTATSWAQAHLGENGKPRWAPSAVRAWMMEPKTETGAKSVNARAVPEEAAELIARESKGQVPAEDGQWPSGISRPRRRVA